MVDNTIISKSLTFQVDDPNMKIIQAMEKCLEGNQNCDNCVYNIERDRCMKNLIKDALHLINHIERAHLFHVDTLHGIIKHCEKDVKYWEEKFWALVEKTEAITQTSTTDVEEVKQKNEKQNHN